MSIKVMSKVWDNSTQKGSTLLLLLAIADFADENGRAWPSIETLAKKIRMSTRSAQMMVRRLVEDGELQVEQNAGPHGCNVYHVLCLEGEKFAGVKSLQGEKFVGGGEKNDTKGVKRASPEPSLDPPIDPSVSTNVDAPTAAQDELLDLPPVGKPKRTRKVNPNSADSWAWITTLAETLGMDARINAKRLGTLKDVLKRGDIELEDVDYFRLRYWPNDKRHQWKEFPSQAELQAEIGRVRAMRLKEIAPKRTEPRITRINMNGKPTDAIEYPDGTTEYREVRA